MSFALVVLLLASEPAPLAPPAPRWPAAIFETIGSMGITAALPLTLTGFMIFGDCRGPRGCQPLRESLWQTAALVGGLGAALVVTGIIWAIWARPAD